MRPGYKAVAVAIGLSVVGLMALFMPLYSFFAEDLPWMRPFGWFAMPEDQPYSEGTVAPGYRKAADQARKTVRAHIRKIGVPAFSAAVAVDGEVVWSAAAGYAKLETRCEATSETLFRIGSTSKPVTGTLFARMIDAGLIDLDTPISAYMGELPNPDWAPITPRQLASHTAGIVGYEENRDLLGAYGGMRLQEAHGNVAEGLEYFDGTDLLYAPGNDFHYSSYDVNLLSAVLQAADSAPFQELMRKRVLHPLGIETPIPDGEHPKRAAFYHVRDGKAQRWRDVDLSMKIAGGGFMAKPADLVRLGIAWLDDGFISPETRRHFWTPQKLAGGAVNEQNYALNWRITEPDESVAYTYIHHGGVSKGAMAWLAVVPERHMAVAMAINTRVRPFDRWGGIFFDFVSIFSEGRPATFPTER